VNEKNVAIVGFMGAGKTSVGRSLASVLQMRFIELDDEIAAKAGKSVQKIFLDEGEPAFRALEREAVAQAARATGAVISCGGGAVIDARNVDALRKTAVIILLAASDEETLRRVGDASSRPLLQHNDKLARIRELKSARRDAYEAAADIVIDTTGLSVREVARVAASALLGYAKGGTVKA